MKKHYKTFLVGLIISLLQVSGNAKSQDSEVDWNKPPAPRPKDPRLELQPVFDSNGVVYDWKAYVSNPVTGEKQEIVISEEPRQYRLTDFNNENVWTLELETYSQSDRLEPKPQGARVTLLDIKHPAGTERPHFEFDVSGQITVAMTLDDVPAPLPPKSIFDPKAIASAVTVMQPIPNTVYVENSAYTHPDRAGGPDVATNSERTLNFGRVTINEIRIYQDRDSGGFAYAWQGGNAPAALSVGRNRHDSEHNWGVVFTTTWGFVQNYHGVTRNYFDRGEGGTNGLTVFLRQEEPRRRERRDVVVTPPPVTP